MEDLIRLARTAALVVAHPDDETLWGAGMLLRYPEKQWTVFCCTIPFHDPERAEKFHDACQALGAYRSIVQEFSERGGQIPIPALDEYDLIVTHGPDGEYGHVQHKELYAAITDMWPDKTICFGYGAKHSDLNIKLNDAEAQKKLHALQCYNHRSRTDGGKMKWEALLETFSNRFDLWREPYTHA